VTGDDGDDVVGQGRERPRPGWHLPRPGWRLSRADWRLSKGSAVLAAVTLLVGLAAGYTAGYRHLRGGPPASGPPTVQPAPNSAAPPPPLTALTPALTQNVGGCWARMGRDLQLGVQVTNQSPAQVTIDQIKAVLPLGGLRAISQQWGPCGALPALQELPGDVLAPGASTWFTVTFKVLRGCPGPLPVQFTVEYDSNGQTAAAILPGFSDLSQVPYPGCPGG
jgi:hypothetical protein